MSTKSELTLLIEKIEEWSTKLGLDKNSTPQAQVVKLYEEFGEVARALQKSDKVELMDGIGDTIVVMTVMYSQLKASGVEGASMIKHFDTWKIDSYSNRGDNPALNFVQCAQSLGRYVNKIIETKKKPFIHEIHYHFCEVMSYLKGICEYHQFNLEECLKMAYATINFRSGEIVDGIFVKVNPENIIKLPLSILKEDIETIVKAVVTYADFKELKFYKIKFDSNIDKLTLEV